MNHVTTKLTILTHSLRLVQIGLAGDVVHIGVQTAKLHSHISQDRIVALLRDFRRASFVQILIVILQDVRKAVTGERQRELFALDLFALWTCFRMETSTRALRHFSSILDFHGRLSVVCEGKSRPFSIKPKHGAQ